MYWLYPSQKKKNITPKQKGKHTTHGAGKGTGLQIHPTNQIQRNTPKKPTKTFGHYLQRAKEKVPRKAGKALAENGSHSRTGHDAALTLLLRGDMWPKFAASPKKTLPMDLVTGSGGKIPTANAIQPPQNTVRVFGVSSTDLETLIFFLKMSNYPLQ